jgi:predicted  nucleic acid-binding Zn-ribbon protein
MVRETAGVRDVQSVERVRCLDCGTVYAKPADGGTVQENPGCPKCGYLGWVTESAPAREPEPTHSGAGQPLRRSGRSD